MGTALKWHNRIYANVKAALEGKCRAVSMDDAKTGPAGYPAVALQLLSSSGTADFQNADMGADISYQADVYTAGAGRVGSAVEIMGLVEDAFRRMGFNSSIGANYGYQQSQGEPDRYRMTGRFWRYVGSGDEIKKL